MKSPYFNDDHELFRKEVRKFMEKEVVPHSDDWEKQHKIPRDVWEKMGKLGFLGINFTETYGGAGMDFFYSVVFLEELGRTLLPGFAAAVTVHEFMAAVYIYKAGSEDLKQRYVVPAIQGKKLGALAITEPHAGSDVAAIRTRAVRQGDHYVVNGSKTFITNGHYGDFLTVAVKTDINVPGVEGISLLVIDHDLPGVSSRLLDKMGWHCSDTAEISFQDVKVPVANLIGQENMGFYYIMEGFQLERLTMGANYMGGADACMEMTIKYISDREAFGKPIAKFQVIRHNLADMASQIEAARQLVYHTAWLHNQGEPAIKESSMVKLLVSEWGKQCADLCLQCYGGYGFMEEFPIARLYRDARVGTIVAGTSEIMREIIAKIVIDQVQYDSGYDKAAKKSPDKSRRSETTPEAQSQTTSTSPSPQSAVAAKEIREQQPPTTTPDHEPLPKTIEELFAGLTRRFRPERAIGWDTVFHFDLADGKTVYQYTVIIKTGTCTVETGLKGEAKCVIKAKPQTYMDIELGKTNAQVAYMMGKVKVSNLSEMMQYIKVFRKLFKVKK